MTEGGDYYSYLLRVWQVPAREKIAWRFQMENIQTGEKQGFASLEELLSYLSQVTSKSNNMSKGNQNEV